MKKSLLLSALAAVGLMSAPSIITRAKTRDVAFPYRMGAGFAGDINRTHPFDVVPGLMNATNPATRYGNALLVDGATSSYRTPLVGDVAVTTIHGILVRPYPTQQSSTSQALGSGVPPTSGIIDVFKAGLIMVNVVGSPLLRGAAFVWAAASGGGHIQGGFEAAATGGSTMAITNAYFNGPPDANGIAELRLFDA